MSARARILALHRGSLSSRLALCRGTGGYTEADVGSCFVRYELMSSAVRAQCDLDGREFDGRKVIGTFVHDE